MGRSAKLALLVAIGSAKLALPVAIRSAKLALPMLIGSAKLALPVAIGSAWLVLSVLIGSAKLALPVAIVTFAYCLLPIAYFLGAVGAGWGGDLLCALHEWRCGDCRSGHDKSEGG